MNDWFRSLSVLGIAFVGVVGLTFGLAALIVPGSSGSAQAPSAAPDASGRQPVPDGGPVTTVGGVLSVTGDGGGTFVLDREALNGRYALVGDNGRITFERDPLSVAQISFDGLEFFPEPDACVITPGERHDPTGVAGAHLRCEEIADVRENGVLTMDGTLGVASNLLGLRGDLPPPGGTVEVGDEVLLFETASITTARLARYAGELVAIDEAGALVLAYDNTTHALSLTDITIHGEGTVVPADACALSTTELGAVNAHTRLVALSIRCDAVAIVGLGTVPVVGDLLVEQIDPPS